ncbi:PREDICTED: 39S ribosomal protein L30, mitochondrial [Gavialis gangeticus]|uniref:39S ribosomal protein L30, mitochondrial n=1 Tax=Gavialis gangeticus TaxID=94835 RepID=UPI00092EAC84|nr:PREDICTED: 39S ribosomal protein L30, mitochondrial [Gavialis gangeticus]
MAALRRAATPAAWEILAKSPQSVFWAGGIRYKFSKSRIPSEVFQPKPSDHEKYGGDPQQPHKLHLVTRIRSVIGRPYWEKKIVKDFGLVKAHQPKVHKNIPSVNSKLRVIKHLIRVQPLKLPHGVPTEEEMGDTYLNSRGELIIRQHLKPVEQQAIES